MVRDLEAQIDELRLKAHKTRSFSPEQVRAEIARLELTVEEYARLMEVSPATVDGWAMEKTRPVGRNLDRWFALQGITRDEARDAVGGLAPKPTGRRPGGAPRSTAEVEAVAARALVYIYANDGCSVGDIGAALGLTAKELQLPIKKLVAGRQVRTTGQKRGTKYHAG